MPEIFNHIFFSLTEILYKFVTEIEIKPDIETFSMQQFELSSI